ncbi:hypothetical protein FGIG_06251 [Fasciola gigantica]|uniref:Uncharacterized protein n=1 Tax=Fasciola gigantica TaxID=46835 RepID=A0A504Z882_FASGI|nr:hypothetical protein FGIG_06251 [Fasciola gigantica]
MSQSTVLVHCGLLLFILGSTQAAPHTMSTTETELNYTTDPNDAIPEVSFTTQDEIETETREEENEELLDTETEGEWSGVTTEKQFSAFYRGHNEDATRWTEAIGHEKGTVTTRKAPKTTESSVGHSTTRMPPSTDEQKPDCGKRCLNELRRRQRFLFDRLGNLLRSTWDFTERQKRKILRDLHKLANFMQKIKYFSLI